VDLSYPLRFKICVERLLMLHPGFTLGVLSVLKAEQEMVTSNRIEPQSISLQDRSLGTTTDDTSFQSQRRYIGCN